MWSLGCLVHLLIAGTPPLHDSNSTRLRQKVGKGVVTIDASWPKAASGAALSFVKALLIGDVKARPTASAALALPWLADKSDATFPTFKASLNAWNSSR